MVWLVVQEGVSETSCEQTVRCDLIADNHAGAGQAAVGLRPNGLARGGVVDHLSARPTASDRTGSASGVGREDDNLDAGRTPQSVEHPHDALVKGGLIGVPERDQGFNVEDHRLRCDVGQAAQHLVGIAQPLVAR